MIQLIELGKRFGNLVAVDGINLKVDSGEAFGFLGPNGAGKTTTIKMMAGLIKPTSGKVVIDGWDLAEHPNRAKKVVGFIPDRPFLYEKLTALEFLKFIAPAKLSGEFPLKFIPISPFKIEILSLLIIFNLCRLQ